MNKTEHNRHDKRYDRFNLAFDLIFFLPRQVLRMIKWLF